jgi:NADPH-dependent ferric siderophore reductase
MRRIRIEGDAVARFDWTPGQHARVHVTDMKDPRNWLRPRDFLRTFTVWDYDCVGLELCVLDHDDPGPGARWAREVRSGDAVTLSEPEGSFTLRDGRYHVFAGDETAAVAFGAMVRALPDAARAYAVIEVGDPDDCLPLDGPPGAEVRWQYRRGRPAAASESLVKGVAALDLPSEPGIAYLAGEARTIQMLRRHLVTDRGWPRRAIVMKPFWTPGRRGLD